MLLVMSVSERCSELASMMFEIHGHNEYLYTRNATCLLISNKEMSHLHTSKTKLWHGILEQVDLLH